MTDRVQDLSLGNEVAEAALSLRIFKGLNQARLRLNKSCSCPTAARPMLKAAQLSAARIGAITRKTRASMPSTWPSGNHTEGRVTDDGKDQNQAKEQLGPCLQLENALGDLTDNTSDIALFPSS